MRKYSPVIALFLALLFVFCGCGGNGHSHTDRDGDGICDECGDKIPVGGTGEYTLPLEDGKNQITFYFYRASGVYDDCDIWMWEEGGAEGRGFLLHPCAYGAKAVMNIDEETTRVGFIVRTKCSEPGGTSWGTATKDATQDDRFVSINQRETEIYLQAGDDKAYSSPDGGVTLLEIITVDMADLRDLNTIRFKVSSSTAMTTDVADIKIESDSGERIEIVSIAKQSNLQATITTKQALTLDKAYTLKIGDLDPVPIVPITYFSSEEFAEAYNYEGKLGVELTDTQTIFRLWAPTASSVVLNLYDAGNGGEAARKIDLVRGERGLWQHTENKNLGGKYYTYTVKTSAGTNEAVDPYAVSAGVNGDRGMILDLDTTDPQGWNNELYIPSTATGGQFNYTDAELWEIHVRDFSNQLTQSKYRGKYLAFTETGLENAAGIPVGVDYLKELGITHVHLMPSYDYATVDETENTGFNWGYDPKNYNVPEGSYSTDPAHGEVRVKEFKQMVQALHAQGIGVVMDVVYNHTSGLDSNLNRIVPYYYYRFQTDGKPSNGSGCGNETASERYMFSRYMVDSVTYWMNEYNVDGFRFDLMGLHDTTTMQEIEKAVHQINPNAIIYGEGWTGGTSTLSSARQSTLANLRSVNSAVGGDENNHSNGIAMFNDVIRDAIKGSVFDANDVGFATGEKASASAGIRFGLNGSVSDKDFGTGTNSWVAYNPTNVINYASAHDNNTLWDRILTVYGEQDALNLKRNRLSAAIVQMALGVPFMQAGEEMLRSKPNGDGTYNENSYNASDEVNNLKWDSLTQTSERYKMMKYYQGLIAFRKAHSTLRLPVASANGVTVNVLDKTATKGAVIAFTMTNPYNGEKLYIVLNAGASEVEVALPDGTWDLFIDGETAGTAAISSGLSGRQKIGSVSCYVYVKQ